MILCKTLLNQSGQKRDLNWQRKLLNVPAASFCKRCLKYCAQGTWKRWSRVPKRRNIPVVRTKKIPASRDRDAGIFPEVKMLIWMHGMTWSECLRPGNRRRVPVGERGGCRVGLLISFLGHLICCWLRRSRLPTCIKIRRLLAQRIKWDQDIVEDFDWAGNIQRCFPPVWRRRWLNLRWIPLAGKSLRQPSRLRRLPEIAQE